MLMRQIKKDCPVTPWNPLLGQSREALIRKLS